MSHWPSKPAARVLAALLRIGWTIKRQSGSPKTLAKAGWPDYVFAFHDREEVGPKMLARIAKLAGAPKTASAGIDLHVQAGEFVERGQPLYTLHASSPGALAYAADYALAQPETIHVIEDAD